LTAHAPSKITVEAEIKAHVSFHIRAAQKIQYFLQFDSRGTHDFFFIMGSNQLRHTSSQGADNSRCCSIRVSQDPILSILASKEDKKDERATQVLERIFFDPKIKRCKSIEWETHIISFWRSNTET
jgi:hypothetical protein